MPSPTRSRLVAAGALTLLLLSPPARGDEPTGEPAPSGSDAAPSRDETSDSVHLTTGAMYRGRLVEIVPDDHVTMVLASGETRRFAWSEIRVVTAGALELRGPARASSSVAPVTPVTPAATTPPALDTPPAITHADKPPAWRPNMPFLVTGVVMFGLSYGAMVLFATPSALNGTLRFLDGRSSLRAGGVQLLVPFVGPILFVENHPRDAVLDTSTTREVKEPLKTFFYLSAAFEIVGGAAILTGLVLGGRSATTTRARPSLHLSPVIAPGFAGASATVSSW